MFGINVAVELLRPGAKWEYNGQQFTRWEDSRPCPSVEEVNDVMEKIMKFEESIPTLFTEEQLAKMKQQEEDFERAIA